VLLRESERAKERESAEVEPRLDSTHLNFARLPPPERRAADDAFANIVLDAAVDEKTNAELGMIVVRGNSVITMEALESMAE
jgi:hypothetical protein